MQKTRLSQAVILIGLLMISAFGITSAATDVDNTHSAEATLKAYFATLGQASNLTVAQMGAAGGTVGMGTEPYATAYRYWNEDWRAEHDYESFVASWSGTAQVKLRQIHGAGGEDGVQRFFVETEHIEAAGDPPRFGTFYYWGFFTLRQTDSGWQITEGKLESENPVWQIGGHQPWLGDPQAVATAYLRSHDRTPQGEGVLVSLEDRTATVSVETTGAETYQLDLVQRQDGIWQVIRLY